MAPAGLRGGDVGTGLVYPPPSPPPPPPRVCMSPMLRGQSTQHPSSGASGGRQWPGGEFCSFPSELSCVNHFVCPLAVSWLGWGISELLSSLLRAAIKQLQPVHLEDMPTGSPFSQLGHSLSCRRVPGTVLGAEQVGSPFGLTEPLGDRLAPSLHGEAS